MILRPAGELPAQAARDGGASPFVLNRRICLVAAGVVYLFALSFALYTNHAWDDWYITYRASKNLATGNGLVFTAGQRVHSFTSPLGTLLPALLSFVTFNRSDDLVLWLFRLIDCGLLSLSALMLLDMAVHQRLHRAAALFVFALFAFDAKIVDFSINGMETALMVFFLVLTLRSLAVPGKQPVLGLGVAWAGLLWTRPDSVVYVGAIAAGFFLFDPPAGPNGRRSLLIRFSRAAPVAVVLYLPWMIWTTAYYGTPIPHTIVAKGLMVPVPDLAGLIDRLASFPLDAFFLPTSVGLTFMPPYVLFGGWSARVMQLGQIVALASAFYWLVPGGRPQGRAVSFGTLVAHFYLSRIAAYAAPWYIPSVALLSIVVLGHVMQHGIEAGANRRTRRLLGDNRGAISTTQGLIAATIVTGTLVMTLAVAYQMRLQQRIIEDGNRKLVGLWLAAHADSKSDTVFSESLGYVGFYSQLKMYDWPGMSSPEMVAARRSLRTDAFAPLIQQLGPKWLVLRPREIEAVNAQSPGLLSTRYRNVTAFDVSAEVRVHRVIPGRDYLEHDERFEIYRRAD